jgi:PAS domain S-box-containing protein
MSDSLPDRSDKSRDPQLDVSELRALVLDRMPIGHIVWDSDFRVVEWNPAAEKIFGWSRDEAKGKPVGSLMLPGAGSPPDCMRRAMERKGSTIATVCAGVNKAGKRVVGEWHNTVLTDDTGRIRCTISLVQDISNRDRTDRELRESRKFLQAIIDSEPECVKLLNPDGTLIMMNRAGLDMIEAESLEQVKGQSVCSLVSPENRESFSELTEQVFQGREGSLTFKMTGLRGRRLWLDTHAVPLRNDRDEIVALLGITRDVTEQKKAEETILEQKKFAEDLVANSAIATFVIDAGHKVVLWNRACEELTGLRAADMIGTDNQWKAFYGRKRPTLADIVIDGDWKQADALYASLKQSTLVPGGLVSEAWYPNLNGKERYLTFEAAPVYNSKGELVVATETLHDVTEHKRAEEILKKERDFTNGIFDTVGSIVLVLDRTGRIVRFNRTCEEVSGYKAEEVIGRNVWDLLIPPEQVDGVKAVFKNLVSGMFPNRYENYWVARDGARKLIAWSNTALLAPDGSVEFVIPTGIDITEHKRLEDQLRQSQKMESIGTLAGGIAHDFNNILTAIIGYSSLLQMKILEGDPLRHSVEQIISAANRAATLTQGLLAYSRKQVLNAQPVNLNDVVKKVGQLLTRVIGEDIELKTITTDHNVTVMADAGQLEQVLMNLATNARDAMPDGGCLFIETERVVFDEETAKVHQFGEPGSYALVSVTDSGVGMDEKVRERIFDPFFTTKEVGKGTGLGLAMTYGIIKQHNGSIDVSSEVGKGSSFKIYLPIVPTAEKHHLPVELPPLMGGTETILLAEDEEVVRELTRHVLEQFGYKVIEAVDGEDAVSKFMENRERIKLLLLDVIMPKKNGREVHAKISIFKPGIKTLFLSGYTSDVMLQQGLVEPEFTFIMKPAPVNDLLRKIRSLLDS